jgi:sigma-B regulation protein RsbU (phosphoserine phosphatase)
MPTTSFSELGWLSSAGEPLTDSQGNNPAVVFVDINVTDIAIGIMEFTLVVFILAIIAAIIIGFVISGIIKKRVTRPVEDLTKDAKLFAQSEDGYKKENITSLDIHTGDEIEELYDATKFMQNSLIEYMENLISVTKEKERIGAELNVATQIQADMLPRIFPPYPERNEFDIYATMTPAKEVGGDFYDFFLIDDDHLAMVVADVSGKGIPAALFMMACKIVINDLATLGITDPAEILYKVNNRIVRNNTLDMFVTVWLGILQISTGKILAANGGHEYPCLMRAGKKFEMLKDRHGLVLGGMENVNYYTYEIQMSPGDVLFTYSDGVPESTNTSNQLFGNDRMLDSLNNDTAASVRQLTLNVKKDIDAFVQEAPQFDDITMLAIRYNGGGNMNEMTVEAVIDNIPAVTAFVDEKLEALKCPMRAETQIDVAIDELFSNIAKYAYHPDTGPATVRVEVENDPLAVVITFIDNGIPYDPLSHNDPDTTLSAEARSIGGLGIYLVKKTMDDITYEYKNGQNILKIKKEI